MPYLDMTPWFDAKLQPQQGEDYQAFMDRVVPAVQQINPQLTEEQARTVCENAWAYYVLENAVEATITIKREFEVYQSSVYMEGWYGDWKVAEIHSAKTPSFTFTSVAKARVVDGDKFHIAKTAEDKQLVFGWANIAKDANGEFPLDWDGDVTDPTELEKAAYTFVLKYRETGTDHEGEAVGRLVESVVFTKEKQEALGIPEGILPEGWWVGFYIEDKEIFEKVKKGEYQMFSVQGKARRMPTGQ